jgi:hypothetical protein
LRGRQILDKHVAEFYHPANPLSHQYRQDIRTFIARLKALLHSPGNRPSMVHGASEVRENLGVNYRGIGHEFDLAKLSGDAHQLGRYNFATGLTVCQGI